MDYLTKILVETASGIDIYFEALEEHIPISEMLPEETPESIENIIENNKYFCAKVSAVINGITLSDDYLGCCIYESYEDFFTTYKNDYYADMKYIVIQEAKKEIKRLQGIQTQEEEVNLYLILGTENVRAWEEKELQAINLNEVIKRTFEDKKQKAIFIQGMAELAENVGFDTYTILDKDEYNLLIN